MKIRIGFVSNSSSSSFVIRGTAIKYNKLIKILKIKPKKGETAESKCDRIKASIRSIDKELIFFSQFYNSGFCDNCYIGLHVKEIRMGCIDEVPDIYDLIDKRIIELLTGNGITEIQLKNYVYHTNIC